MAEDQQEKKEKYVFQELEELEQKVLDTKLPEDLRHKLLGMIERLNRMAKFGGYSREFEIISRYINWVVALPWYSFSEDNLNIKEARTTLDENHYGMGKVKERILEYLAVLKLKKEKSETEDQAVQAARASVLCLVGLPGVGKTSMAYSVAEAMNRDFIRIAMGGLGSAAQLRGISKSETNAEPGEVIKGLRDSGHKNPVILFDEIDRVSQNARADVMGVLLELLDPEQNNAFTDYYIDFPFDLSSALFICSANNTGGIANAVLDRLEIIEMPSYTDEEKKTIGKEYLLPKALEDTGLREDQLVIKDDLWPKIIRPLGYDAGIRTLDRTLRGICRKVAKLIVEDKGDRFVLDENNIKKFLPKY